MTTEPTRPILRYHGGKWLLAPWIIDHFPTHTVYVEPFGGAASVLLRKQRVYAEVYNDLDGEIVNLFHVMRDQPDELRRVVELTPYAREEFELSTAPAPDELEQARRTLVRSYMGYGGNLTRLTVTNRLERTGFRDYSKKNRMSIPANDWRNWPDAIASIADRLRGVIIEHRPALDVMAKHDGETTLHYVDPPYVSSTRNGGRTNGKRGYRHEMTDTDHDVLAQFLRELKGMVIVSGYDSPLYEDLYRGWRRASRRARADGARERVEVLWLSPAVPESEFLFDRSNTVVRGAALGPRTSPPHGSTFP